MSNTYVMVQNFEMRIYISIFFSSFPNGVFHKTLEIALLLQTKSRREGKEKLPARMSQAQFMQPSNDLLRHCHGVSVRHEMAFYHCFC